jgi:hypothetical protein
VSGVRGRRLTAIIAAALLALTAAGCGSDENIAQEVPGAPADFALPESTVEASASEDAAADEDSATDEESTDEGTAPEETAPSDDTGATTPDTSGGSTAPDAEADGPTNDTAPPEGSEAEQFEDFCAQNPGAC